MGDTSANSKSQISAMVVGSKYRLQHKLGSGSFGDIYQAVNINSGEVKCFHVFCPSFYSRNLFMGKTILRKLTTFITAIILLIASSF